ncbi:hypothetical protein Syn7502_03662 (plasmid) [Synechococcus sp. PCC 7502]|uniref:plasmid replication protein, CyRepA1 family n=1 Tax=Synechococcus sp. PCC 7502 TaxID=1173263 RepID=UPI00029FFA1E|nr:plasmid replication protein, CyRepA1 family [Synechococcus sp. PCC 7502]AFY75484.1 hypothetical protein Syn7502_03662 [Synechococcus sp. PCC 7502]
MFSQALRPIEVLSLPDFEAFKAKMRSLFIRGSGIHPDLFEQFRFISDIDTSYSGEWSSELYDILGFDYKRFRHSANANMYALLLENEDRSIWQVVLSDPSDPRGYRYVTPTGNGNKAFTPPIPVSIRQKISDRYGVDVPLTRSFWDWYNDHRELNLITTEGGKKSLATLSEGIVAIAVYGANCLKSPDLIPYIGDRNIIIALDQDTKLKAKITVNQGKRAGVSFARKHGAKSVNIAVWNPNQGKGLDDLKIQSGVEVLESVLNNAIAATSNPSEWHQLSPDLVLNQRWCQNIVIPDSAKLVVLRSPMYTGKTAGFLFEQVQRAKDKNQKVLVITHRTQLIEELCNNFGLRTKYELSTGTKSEQSDKRLEANIYGLGYVVDSLHPDSSEPFDATQWHDALIIIDECEQVLAHTFNSSTDIDKHRLEVLAQIKQLIVQTANSEYGRIILSDAGLTQLSIDFVQKQLRQPMSQYVVVNQYKFSESESWNISSYQNPIQVWSKLYERLDSGDHLLIHTDSQQFKGKQSGVNIEAMLNKKYPHLKTLLIDSKTIANPDHPAYQAIARGLDTTLVNYDVVIATPAIETGVSINLKGHFNAVFGFFCGVSSVDSTLQTLARLRDPVDRFVWFATRGLGFIANGSAKYQELINQATRQTAKNISLLKNFGDRGIDLNPNLIALETWAKMSAKTNAGLANFRKFCELDLESAGHTVTKIAVSGNLDQLNKEVLDNRDQNWEVERTAIADVELPDQKVLESIKAKKSKTENEHRVIRKDKLHNDYSIEVNPDLVKADDLGFKSKFRLHYYLTVGREYLAQSETKNLENLLQSDQGSNSGSRVGNNNEFNTHDPESPKNRSRVWTPKARKRLIGRKVKILEILGIDRWLEPNQDFRGSDYGAIKLANMLTPDREFDLNNLTESEQVIVNTAIATRADLKDTLGITIHRKDSPILIVQRLLSCLGLRLTKVSRDKVNGKAGENVYQFKPDELEFAAIRSRVFDSWLDKDRESGSRVGNIEQFNTHDPVDTTDIVNLGDRNLEH